MINLILSYQIYIFIYSFLSFIGLSISYFIIKEALGIHNKTVAKVCEKISKQSGCSGVINDKKSNLFNLIALSDASVVYFLINTITLIIIGFNFTLFFFITVFSIPIVLLTIYYQGLVLKKWCALCLGISTIMISQFLVLLLNRSNLIIDFSFLMQYLFIILITIIAFYFFKELWVENAKLQLVKKEFLKFRRDKELFDTVLSKEVLINNKLIVEEKKVTFGSENPLIIIDAVTNPLCGFCSESFNVYYKLLTSRSDVQINFIFSVPNDIKSTEMQIAVSILNIYFNENKDKAFEAMKDWYFDREIDAWKKKYSISTIISAEIFSVLKNQQNWLQVNGVKNIPATFIDNYYFPKVYNIEDLLMFVDDIILEKQNSI